MDDKKTEIKLFMTGILSMLLCILIALIVMINVLNSLELKLQDQVERFDLTKVMRLETIGMNKDWLERRIGPPRSGDTYEINGCDVEINFSEKSVSFVTLNKLSSKCTFDSGLIGLSGPADLLKFIDLTNAGNWQASFSCYNDCGNAIEPTYGLTVEGPHSVNFMTYSGSATYQTVGEHVEALKKLLLKIFPPETDVPYPSVPDALDLEKNLGQEKFNQLWLSVFKDAHMESIGFGH